VVQSQEKLSLIEAIQRAGSLTSNAKAGQIFLVRLMPDKTTRTTEIAFNSLYKKGNFAVNVPLESYDVIWAPRNKVAHLQDVANAVNPITSILGGVIIYKSISQ